MQSEIVKAEAKEYADALGGEWRLEDARFDGVRKLLKNMGEEFEQTILWSLRDSLHDQLAWKVRECAGKAIEAVLRGDDGELKRWLSCDAGAYTGRSNEGPYARSLNEAHPIIHGRLFEQGAIALRRAIVDAHPDLLKNERIRDLEDQIAAVTLQHNKLKDKLAELQGDYA